MADSIIYNQEGKENGKVALPESVFGLAWNGDLVHQVVTAMQANARTPVAHTKDRGDVRGGGKKPWRQKGTGRARHGSTRSPIWKGGGVTFGPRNDKDYSQKLNKKAKTKALYTALSQKLRDGEILFVDSLTFPEPKAKTAQTILASLSGVKGFETLLSKKKNSAFLALGEKDAVVQKSFNNFGNVEVDEVRNLNADDVLRYKYLIIAHPETSIEFLLGKNKGKLTGTSKKEEKPEEKAEAKEDVKETKEETKKAPAKTAVKKKAPAKKAPTKKVVKKTTK